MKKKRASGVLLHITSLPSKYGVGDLGPDAYRFADFLHRAKQSYWQVLPLNPPAMLIGHCPYSCLSAFAGNPLLISPEILFQQGLLKRKDIKSIPEFRRENVDYRSVIPYKYKLLNIAYKRFKNRHDNNRYEQFCLNNADWLEDYALFAALRERFGYKLWHSWPPELRDRKSSVIKWAAEELDEIIGREKFFQYQFFRQWSALKDYCSTRGVGIIGDIPIYVSFDSADVWANPHFFKLTARKKPKVVSGVAPDHFSRKGQLWGNPIYNWPKLKHCGFSWWIDRFKHNLKLFDIVRIDHFRAFVAYWQVPAACKTAVKGRWVRAPKDTFFRRLLKHVKPSQIIVEDLGYITPAVKAFVKKHRLSGMKILLHGFDGDTHTNSHAVQNHVINSVVYTGTHDNNTVRGWFEHEANSHEKKKLFHYLKRKPKFDQLHWHMIDLAMNSRAKLAIIPMQDILGLGRQARMNLPATTKGNWTWRLTAHQITPAVTDKLAKLTSAAQRA